MNGCIVNDEDRIGQRPFVHAWKKTFNELPKYVAGNGILDNLKM